MERALIIGASGGIGGALVRVMREQGIVVTALSRSVDGLDVTDEHSVSNHLDRLDGPFHKIIVATGALEIADSRPEKSISQWTAAAMVDQFSLNAVGPALVLKHAKRLLARQERTVFAALSARVGSIGDNRLGGWVSYRSAKAALNQIIRTASIELSRSHKQSICVSLHPGTVATEFTRDYVRTHPAVGPDDSAKSLVRVMDGLTVDDTGQFFDWAGRPVPW